jgi:hypothetical protein
MVGWASRPPTVGQAFWSKPGANRKHTHHLLPKANNRDEMIDGEKGKDAISKYYHLFDKRPV